MATKKEETAAKTNAVAENEVTEAVEEVKAAPETAESAPAEEVKQPAVAESDDGEEKNEVRDIDDVEEDPVEKTEEKPAAKKMPKKPGTKKEKAPEEKAEKAEKAEVAEKAEKKVRKSNILREKKRAISKDVTGDDLIVEQTAFNTFSGTIASKERRKELLEDVTVITEDGEEAVETLATIRNREYLELRGSAQAGKILSGEVIGVRYTDPENPKSMVVADIRYKTGAIRVTIPAFLMFDYDEEQYTTERGNREIFEAIKKRINANIKFVASYVNQDEGTCVGDRLRASAMNSSRFYLNGWKGQDTPRVIPGTIVQGRVYAVGSNYVIVDALGADIRVPRDEISYMFVGDARQKFTVSDMVNVYITEVKEKNVTKGRNSYRLVHAKGSIKKAYPNMRKKYFDEFPIGLNTSALITYIDDNAHVFCELSGGKIDCLCPFPSLGAVPVVGQKRVVQITGRDENEYRLFGTIQNT